MSYANAWNESTPTSATVANTIAAYWTDNMKAIRERIDDVFGTSGSSSINTADPYKPYLLKLTGQADSYIQGGSGSFGIVNNAGDTYNLKILDNGNVLFRAEQFIPSATTYAFRDTTNTYDNVQFLDNGNVNIRGAIGAAGATFVGTVTIEGQGNFAEVDVGNVTGATDIDFADGNNQLMTLTGNATLSFLNTANGGVYILRIKQDATGSRTITWTDVTWGGGVAPTLTTTANYSDVITLYKTGSALLGFIGALAFNA